MSKVVVGLVAAVMLLGVPVEDANAGWWKKKSVCVKVKKPTKVKVKIKKGWAKGKWKWKVKWVKKWVKTKLPKCIAKKLVKKGKAVWPGEYYVDADDDGFGSTADVFACPASDRVEVAGDCDDADPNVHPDAAEVCGDALDNNCSGEVDEACATATCPCFDTATLEAARDEFLAESWDQTEEICEDWTFYGDGFSYDWAKLYWSGSHTDAGVTTSHTSFFYSVDYDDNTQETYCVRSIQNAVIDDATGGYTGYDEDYDEAPLSLEQHAACMDVIFQYADDQQITCEVTQYP